MQGGMPLPSIPRAIPAMQFGKSPKISVGRGSWSAAAATAETRGVDPVKDVDPSKAVDHFKGVDSFSEGCRSFQVSILSRLSF